MDAGMRRILERLRQGLEAEYGFLGVVPAQTAESGGGILLREVTPGSPAYAAGLRHGHILEAINGVQVRHSDDLFLQVGTLLPASEVELKIRGRTTPIRLQLAKLYIPGTVIASRKPAAARGIRVDYTSALYLQMRRTISIPRGVYVREILPGSAAYLAQLKLNEIITHVNGAEVSTPTAFYREAAKVSASEPLKLRLSAQDFHRTESTELVIP
jgi:S1-C subfamily serine protease